ncbi:hypothetical protein Q1695_006389 [Nippostrongylus brasiliensis]|nr:hypothetical protein Q1695_006389 [Nippostrongylus brasiliensis]
MPGGLTEVCDSPSDDDSSARLLEDAGQNDIEVRTAHESEIERRIRSAQRLMSEITVECERVLGRVMRTSNPLRDEVWEAVHRQVQLASEGIKEIIEQGAGIEQQPNEFSEVCEILGIAGLNETSRLEKFLDESVENERCAREICGVLQCEKSELVTRVAELKKAVDTIRLSQN